MALFTHLPPVRKQIARPAQQYARAQPQSVGGLFGPTPPAGKPSLATQQLQSPREPTLRSPRDPASRPHKR